MAHFQAEFEFLDARRVALDEVCAERSPKQAVVVGQYHQQRGSLVDLAGRSQRLGDALAQAPLGKGIDFGMRGAGEQLEKGRCLGAQHLIVNQLCGDRGPQLLSGGQTPQLVGERSLFAARKSSKKRVEELVSGWGFIQHLSLDVGGAENPGPIQQDEFGEAGGSNGEVGVSRANQQRAPFSS